MALSHTSTPLILPHTGPFSSQAAARPDPQGISTNPQGLPKTSLWKAPQSPGNHTGGRHKTGNMPLLKHPAQTGESYIPPAVLRARAFLSVRETFYQPGQMQKDLVFLAASLCSQWCDTGSQRHTPGVSPWELWRL